MSEGRLFTPSLECGVLAGVTRAKVLAWAGRAAASAAVPMAPSRAARSVLVMVSSRKFDLSGGGDPPRPCDWVQKTANPARLSIDKSL
ncbi:MAG: hypothetical protein ACK414_10280 [Gemmobacter sp.]